MSGSATNWVANKLGMNADLEIVGRSPEDFLAVRSRGGATFLVAVLGVNNVIDATDVAPLFVGSTKPQFVVNVPSSVLWSGPAIDLIHAESAAFGTVGDVLRAANMEDPGLYRDKSMGYFINAMSQHSNVYSVSYVYETVFKVDRKAGASVTVAIIDAYNMSAEDVRNAKTRFGYFDAVVKSSTYGSITRLAEAAAESMGAKALTFRELMGWLAK